MHNIRKDGTTFWCNANVSTFYHHIHGQVWVAVHEDITERKRAEEVLRESEEKYRTLINSLNEGIWVIDKDAITTFVNPKMARILGYTMGDMTGRSLFSFMDEKGRRLCEEYIERRRFGIREQHYFEFLKRDGTRIYASVEATSIKGKHGEYLGAIAGVIDITKRKWAEDALMESEVLFREVFNNANDSVFLLERTPNGPGKYLLVNDKAIQMLGYSKEEFMKMSPRDLVP